MSDFRDTRKAKRQRALLQLLAPQGAWTNRKHLAIALQISEPLAGRALDQAASAGLVGSVGRGCASKWFLAERVEEEKQKRDEWLGDAYRRQLARAMERQTGMRAADAADSEAAEHWAQQRPTQLRVPAPDRVFVKRGPVSVFDLAALPSGFGGLANEAKDKR